MSKFTERLEHDLSQIADRAAPSSTAWESIQQRIDEQTTQPTMEVIMLNPDQKKPSNISRTWLAVAAALVLVVGIGSLFAVFNQDDESDIDTLDIPEVTVPLELDDNEEPDVIVPDEDAADDGSESAAAVPDPDEPLERSGFAVADCEFGTEDLDTTDANFTGFQSCVFRDADLVPFAANQRFEITTYIDPEFHDAEAHLYVPITGLSDSGFMYAGYMVATESGNNARTVGVAQGVGRYERMLIYVSGRSLASDGGVVHMQWVAGGGDLSPLMISGTDVVAEESTSSCQGTPVTLVEDDDPATEEFQTVCSYTDASLFPASTAMDVYFFGLGPSVPTVGDSRYMITPGAELQAGIIDGRNNVLTVSISEGVDEQQGLLIHGLTSGRSDNFAKSILEAQRVALPPAE